MINALPSEFVAFVDDPKHREEVVVTLAAIACATDELRVAYLSVPVTTGPTFVDWFCREGRLTTCPEQYVTALRANVIDVNVSASRAIATKTRSHWHGVVFNPALLYVRNWSQADYLTLFLSFIQGTAERVVLSDGWALSNGCSIEAACAFRWGITITDPLGERVEGPAMLAALHEATCRLTAACLPAHVQIAAMKVISCGSHTSEANG